jgi:hypothetical protein
LETSVPRDVNATIHFNTDRYVGRRITGVFDYAEFAKLMQDFDSFIKSPTKATTPYYYVIYPLDNLAEGQELSLFFHEVESIQRDK